MEETRPTTSTPCSSSWNIFGRRNRGHYIIVRKYDDDGWALGGRVEDLQPTGQDRNMVRVEGKWFRIRPVYISLWNYFGYLPLCSAHSLSCHPLYSMYVCTALHRRRRLILLLLVMSAGKWFRFKVFARNAAGKSSASYAKILIWLTSLYLQLRPEHMV